MVGLPSRFQAKARWRDTGLSAGTGAGAEGRVVAAARRAEEHAGSLAVRAAGIAIDGIGDLQANRVVLAAGKAHTLRWIVQFRQ